MLTLSQISQFIRWRDWGPGKLTLLWAISLYLVVAYDIPFSQYILTFLVFIVFAATQSAMGFVLNDWGDRFLDRRQFKHNSFTGMTRLESILALTLICVAAVLSGLPLILRSGFLMLWIAWAFSTVAYSLEPIRLKTKGAVGLIASFVAQWLLPILITFAAFEAPGGRTMWMLAIALTISGAALEIGHQRLDRQRDMLTRAETFAVTLKDEKVDLLYAIALFLDKLAVGIVVALVALTLTRLETPWAQPMAYSLAAVYIVLFFFTIGNVMVGIRGGEIVDPYYSKSRNMGSLLHETLLNFGAPVLLALAATLQDPRYGFVLGFFIFWRIVISGADVIWPLRAIRIRLRH
jgi:4-hydroxybenzoate polyprenyltransferase